MVDIEIIDKSRHFFQNCRAAFRLLQGAIISGNYAIDEVGLKSLENKFIQLEKKLEVGDYDVSNTIYNDVQRFFLMVSGQANLNGKNNAVISALSKNNTKVLVVDDQYNVCGWKEVFELIFGPNNVVGITSSATAIEFAENNSNELFLVFVDLNMPDDKSIANNQGKEGMDLISEISNILYKTPIVVFTAYDSAIIAKKAFEHGAWDYFAKEPIREETKEFKLPQDYYNVFYGIIERYLAYYEQYSPLWNEVILLEAKLKANMDEGFRNLVCQNLRLSYKFLIMDSATRFNPQFLKIDKYEEVIFQSAKALESYISWLYNHYNIYPGPTSTLGNKIKFIGFNKIIFKVGKDWCKKGEIILNIRNKNTHQDVFEKGKYAPRIKNTSVDNAIFVFESTIQLIAEAHIHTTNTP